MSDKNPKSKPIPTRHDDDVIEMVEALNETTGISKAEIIRRAVRFALLHAKDAGSLNFLLGEPDELQKALDSVKMDRGTTKYEDRSSTVAPLKVAEETAEEGD